MSDEELIQEVIGRVSTFDLRTLGATPEPEVSIEYRRASVLLPITVRDGEVLLLLTKRSKHLRSHPSTVAFPGGMRDDVDSSDVDAALREAEEEIGLPPSAVKVLGVLTLGVTLPTNVVYPVVGLIPNDFQPSCNPSEVDYAFYVPLRTFIDKDKVKHQTGMFKGKPFHFPVVHYSHDDMTDKIFGFTCNYCILLAKIVFEAEDVAKQMATTLELYFHHGITTKFYSHSKL